MDGGEGIRESKGGHSSEDSGEEGGRSMGKGGWVGSDPTHFTGI